MSRDDDRLVHSSEGGSVQEPRERRGRKGGRSRQPRGPARPADPDDGVARVRRDRKGRKGKTVTTVSGLRLDDAALRELAAELKRRCGSGGSLVDGVIEIQGDHVETVVAELSGRGFAAKRAGG